MNKSITSGDYRIFLRELRAVRTERGVSQIDLATRLGETQSFVSKCVRGERRLDILELRTFCKALDLSVESFLKRLERALFKSGS